MVLIHPGSVTGLGRTKTLPVGALHQALSLQSLQCVGWMQQRNLEEALNLGLIKEHCTEVSLQEVLATFSANPEVHQKSGIFYQRGSRRNPQDLTSSPRSLTAPAAAKDLIIFSNIVEGI